MNQAEVEARGRVRSTRWTPTASRPVSSADRRADRHPLRARARRRRQGQPGHQPQGHRLRDGVGPTCASWPRSRAARPSASRCPTTTASWWRSATSCRRPRPRRATHPLEVAVGRDISRRAVMANLAEMPHILIAGATGAGKSSCINSPHHVAAGAHHARAGPPDPRRPQAGRARPVQRPAPPAHPVVVNPKKAANALSWAVQGDGAPLRPALRGRRPRHHRLQRHVRRRRPATASAGPERRPGSITTGCRSS